MIVKGFLGTIPAPATVTFKAGDQVVRDNGDGRLVGDTGHSGLMGLRQHRIDYNTREYLFRFRSLSKAPVTVSYVSVETGLDVEEVVVKNVQENSVTEMGRAVARTEGNRLPGG